jgi:hypothetical protein
MSGRNGERRPPRPRIEMLTGGASESEAAAIVAALEQFMADTAPSPSARGPAPSPWQRAALEEGIGARQVSGRGWGPAVARRPGSG